MRELNPVAQFTKNAEWAEMPNGGLNSTVFALGTRGQFLFVGGQFVKTSDGAVLDLNRIAMFDAGANVKLNSSARKGNAANEYVVTLTVINRGPGVATGIQLLDVIPAGYKPIGASAPCGIKKQKVSCALSELQNDQRHVIEITVKVVGNQQIVTNCAEVTTTSYDPNPDNRKSCTRIPPF
jgi:uncharacterized repeat protein (TIGR01451 family)